MLFYFNVYNLKFFKGKLSLYREILSIYVWLCWVFYTHYSQALISLYDFIYLFMYGCAGSSLLCGFFSRHRAWISHGSDFSSRGAQALGQAGVSIRGHGLSRCSFWTGEHRLSSCGA